jgi:hypothetical protein
LVPQDERLIFFKIPFIGLNKDGTPETSGGIYSIAEVVEQKACHCTKAPSPQIKSHFLFPSPPERSEGRRRWTPNANG